MARANEKLSVKLKSILIGCFFLIKKSISRAIQSDKFNLFFSLSLFNLLLTYKIKLTLIKKK